MLVLDESVDSTLWIALRALAGWRLVIIHESEGVIGEVLFRGCVGWCLDLIHSLECHRRTWDRISVRRMNSWKYDANCRNEPPAHVVDALLLSRKRLHYLTSDDRIFVTDEPAERVMG